MSIRQKEQKEWYIQWQNFKDETEFLFFDWIYPRTLDDFAGKRVLDAGCGPGHHVRIVAPVAQHVIGVDLNTGDLAQDWLQHLDNVTILQEDIASYLPETKMDVVYCIGVIHHTDDPDKTFQNLTRMIRDGGLLIVWCYSREGNGLVVHVVEPLRRLFLQPLPRRIVYALSILITLLMYPVVFSVYLLPLTMLPFYDYFKNFRKLSFKRNLLNVFDKLNAPQTEFISHERVTGWFSPQIFEDISITPYNGVSWRASGYKKPSPE